MQATEQFNICTHCITQCLQIQKKCDIKECEFHRDIVNHEQENKCENWLRLLQTRTKMAAEEIKKINITKVRFTDCAKYSLL